GGGRSGAGARGATANARGHREVHLRPQLGGRGLPRRLHRAAGGLTRRCDMAEPAYRLWSAAQAGLGNVVVLTDKALFLAQLPGPARAAAEAEVQGGTPPEEAFGRSATKAI